MANTFTNGSKVSFLPGPRSTSQMTGTVQGQDGQFLVVNCQDGKQRKIRPGSCTAA